MADTKIEWADKVWNPIAGCTKCSPGCLNCYAERMAHRLKHICLATNNNPQYLGKTDDDGHWTGEVECCDWILDQPLHWRKPKRIFVCSMSDLFHKKVPFGFINKVINRIYDCPQHTFLILTKRANRMLEYYNQVLKGYLQRENIQFNLSISTQAEADKNIPILLQIPAAIRGLSIEPMLGPIDLIGKDKSRMGKTGYLPNYFTPFFCNDCGRHLSRPPTQVTELCRYCGSMSAKERKSISWVVVGGESGPGARYCNIENIRSVVRQCKVAGVPVFVKQIHLWKLNETDRLFETKNDALFYSCRILHPEIKWVLIKDINQFPEDLRIQQLPERR